MRTICGPAVLVVAALCAAAAPAHSAPRPPPGFRSLSYDVRLTPDFGSGVLTGTERLRIQSLAEGVDTLSFTANTLAVAATLDGEPGVATTVEGRRLVVRLPRRLRRGERTTLLFAFSGRPGPEAPFTPDQLHTGFFTCHVMICDDDRPGDRAPLRLSLTVPLGMDAVAPGRLVSRTAAGAGLETWRWREDRPYPAYLYGFAVGRYARAALPGGPGLSVLYADATPDRIQAMFGDTGRMLAFYAEKAGLGLPEGRYTQVLVDRRGDQEGAGLSMIARRSIEPILADPHEDWIVAHELAHQWWGDLVTCADWRELWLNEGMTTFMVAAYKEARWGRAAYHREIAIAQADWDAARTAGLDRPLSWAGDYPTLRDKRRIAYGKSVVFLARLRTELGDAAFWRAVRAYTRADAGRSVTARDLQRAFETASGRDLSSLFRSWVHGEAEAAA